MRNDFWPFDLLCNGIGVEAVKEATCETFRSHGDACYVSSLFHLGNFEQPPAGEAQAPQENAYRKSGDQSCCLKYRHKWILNFRHGRNWCRKIVNLRSIYVHNAIKVSLTWNAMSPFEPPAAIKADASAPSETDQKIRWSWGNMKGLLFKDKPITSKHFMNI